MLLKQIMAMSGLSTHQRFKIWITDMAFLTVGSIYRSWKLRAFDKTPGEIDKRQCRRKKKESFNFKLEWVTVLLDKILKNNMNYFSMLMSPRATCRSLIEEANEYWLQLPAQLKGKKILIRTDVRSSVGYCSLSFALCAFYFLCLYEWHVATVHESFCPSSLSGPRTEMIHSQK